MMHFEIKYIKQSRCFNACMLLIHSDVIIAPKTAMRSSNRRHSLASLVEWIKLLSYKSP